MPIVLLIPICGFVSGLIPMSFGDSKIYVDNFLQLFVTPELLHMRFFFVALSFGCFCMLLLLQLLSLCILRSEYRLCYVLRLLLPEYILFVHPCGLLC